MIFLQRRRPMQLDSTGLAWRALQQLFFSTLKPSLKFKDLISENLISWLVGRV